MNILTALVKDVSFIGNGFLIPTTLLVVYFIYFWFVHEKKDSWLLLISSFSYVYSLALKLIFKENRPLLNTVVIHTSADKYSFPSSHVTFYMAFFGFIVYFFLKEKRTNIILRVFSIVSGIVLISLIGVSRVILNAHWPIDVVGGYIFGGIYLFALIGADKLLNKERQNSVSKDKDHNN